MIQKNKIISSFQNLFFNNFFLKINQINLVYYFFFHSKIYFIDNLYFLFKWMFQYFNLNYNFLKFQNFYS